MRRRRSVRRHGKARLNGWLAYRCPVWIIGGDDFVLRKSKDALLEYELRVGGPHSELRESSRVVCVCVAEERGEWA